MTEKKLILETVCPNCECEIQLSALYDGNVVAKLARTEAALKHSINRLKADLVDVAWSNPELGKRWINNLDAEITAILEGKE